MAALLSAPVGNFFTSDGERGSLESLYQDGPIALVFLRHLGCVFCLEQALALNGHPDLPIYFVAMGAPQDVCKYKDKVASPHRFLCDPDEDLYREMGLLNATPSQVFTFQTFGRGLTSALHGRFNHRSSSNMARLGGAFLIGTDGSVLWSRPTRQVSDIVTGQEIRSALAEAACKP